MVSKKLRKVMHKLLAVVTSATLIATASVGAGFTVFAEDEYENATETVISDPLSDNPDEQVSPKEVGSITSDYEGIFVSNGGEVIAHGNVTVVQGDGIFNAGGTVQVEGNVDAASEGSSGYSGIYADGVGTTNVKGNVTGQNIGIDVTNGGVVNVNRNVIGQVDGIDVTNEGVVNVKGNVTGLGDDGINISGDYYELSADNSGDYKRTVTVGGDVTGQYGLYISNGKVDVAGNVTATDYTGITARGNSDIKVGIDVTAGDNGINVDSHSKVEVVGDVTAEGTGIYAENKSNVKVGGNVTAELDNGITAMQSNINVDGNVTAGENGIRSQESTITVKGSVKGSGDVGVESTGSNITIGKDVEGNHIGIKANIHEYEGLDIERFLDAFENDTSSSYIGRMRNETIPSKVNVGGNVTGGIFGVASDYGSTVHVKGDVTATGKLERRDPEDPSADEDEDEEDEDEDEEDTESDEDGEDTESDDNDDNDDYNDDSDDNEIDILSKLPSAAIAIIIGDEDNHQEEEPRRLVPGFASIEDFDPDAGENPEAENQGSESVKGVVIVEGTVKAEDNGNGAYGVLLCNNGYESAAEVIAATPDIVVYEFNLGDNGEVVGYQDYSTSPDRYDERRMIRATAATDEENLADDMDADPSEETGELAEEVIETVKGLINYIIKHDEGVTLDSLNDGEDVRVYGELETMRIGEVLTIKFQEGYKLDNEDYLKTIATVEMISDGVYKITLTNELGGINIKSLFENKNDDPDEPEKDPDEPEKDPDEPEKDPDKPQEDPVKPQEEPEKPQEDPVKPQEEPEKPQEDPVKPQEDPIEPQEDPIEPQEEPIDQPQEDPVEQPQEEQNDEPIVVIVEVSEPAPAPVSNPEPVLVPLVAGATAPAPAPAPASGEPAVLGARKGSTEDTANSPIRAMIILFASLGVIVACGTKYFVKEN